MKSIIATAVPGGRRSLHAHGLAGEITLKRRQAGGGGHLGRGRTSAGLAV